MGNYFIYGSVALLLLFAAWPLVSRALGALRGLVPSSSKPPVNRLALVQERLNSLCEILPASVAGEVRTRVGLCTLKCFFDEEGEE